VLIHFPIALVIAGVVFDFLAQSTNWRALLEVAYYNLLGAAISALPVVATGLLAWRFPLEGQKLKGILLSHLVLGSRLHLNDPPLDRLGTPCALSRKVHVRSPNLPPGAGNAGGGNRGANGSARRLPQRSKWSQLVLLEFYETPR
jgi:hypothetical protein